MVVRIPFNDLIQVSEPATSSEPSGSTTYYYYDLLDHMVGTWMGRTAATQTRNFTYSGNFLTSATNPENGTVHYTYNSYGKVATKFDAKGQQIVYTYDSLARLTKVQRYTANPRIKVYAIGVPYAGVYPTMTLTMGGTVLGSWTVYGVTYLNYTVAYAADLSPANLRITFTNAESTATRQLYVPFITIDGTNVGPYNDSCSAYIASPGLNCTGGYLDYSTTSFGVAPAPTNEDTCQQENYYYDTPYDSGYTTSYLSGRLTAVKYYGGSATYGNYGAPGSCDTRFEELYKYNQAGARIGKKLRVTRSVEWDAHPFIISPPTFVDTSVDLDSTYTYDMEGRMTAEQYPASGPNLGWGFDTMGRLNSMMDLGTTSPIITAATYGPAGEMLTMNGNVSETRTYNSMLQLKRLQSSAYPVGVDVSYNYPSTGNNGKIASQTDNVSGEQVVYTYDAINRLASATESTHSWGQSYSYDGFGNLTAQTVTYGSAPAYTPPGLDSTTNRVGGTDENGNSLNPILGANPAYDIENRLSTVGTLGAAYSYAPGNKRVWRGVWNSGSLTTDELTYWSVNGKKLGTYNIIVVTGYGSTAPVLGLTQTTANYYFGSKLIKNGFGTTGYVPTDRLGSIGHYYPYGQEKPSATTNGTEKFTGYLRDSETGLDYADQRYHSPGTGRFLTADRYMASGGPSNPGSWNRYAYAGGDPTNFVDPTGRIMAGPGSCDELGDCDTCVNLDPFDPEWEPLCQQVPVRRPPPPPQKPKCNSDDAASQFILANYDAVAAISAAQNFPLDWLFAWIAQESGWGASYQATQNNNFLNETKRVSQKVGLWAGATACGAGAYAGTVQGVPGINFSCFPSLTASVNAAFASSVYGPILAYANTFSVASILQEAADAGFDPGNPNYGQNVANTVPGVDRRINCLEQKGLIP